MSNHTDILKDLFQSVTKELPTSIVKLPKSGSSRVYYRIQSSNKSFIGTFNEDVNENLAFSYLSSHLESNGIPVPKILAISDCKRYYIQTDLGSISLLDKILHLTPNDNQLLPELKNVVKFLARFNAKAYHNIDISKLYPVKYFDKKSATWDLNYFKYCFLNPSDIQIDENKLDDIFDYIADKVLDVDNQFLQYRDFQSRNIMLTNNGPFFIDFQSARIGSGLYDLASFLFQARANFSSDIRNKLLEYYIDELSTYRKIDKFKMLETFPFMALFRVLQTLGAYGFRGLVERKSHFLQSIPLALNNLNQLLESINDSNLIYLNEIAATLKQLYSYSFGSAFNGLTLNVYSFSLKKGYPPVNPEHGGGFVFDCRFLPNPGRIDEFKPLTGLDKPVISYLDKIEQVSDFMSHAFAMIKVAIDQYITRDFKHLSVGFGCTGGQHRSVYCAERFARMVKGHFTGNNIKVIVKHIELER
ncbi:MAG: hypothetical protein PWR03_1815 [Tenuifilum sp.]|jgi:aminoglycoside/choline kinase family phosphotransferase|uniref:RapZ C-terminal domain-containing protein n=1 Tax=Tenuifilum sp. TaxID=2760880 RepID=UPI0024AC040A|nr:RNase adapter RapZ [Tenuifilum sp.]MDI3527632.1 hypothetical protein [Tenuifilum sp.]